MKNPPTLADQCIATMLDKRMAGGANPNNIELREMLGHIAPARKFVLDESMSKYLLDLSRTLLRGGVRKRINQINNARQLARLPHPLTWIEYDYRAHLGRARELGLTIHRGPGTKDDDPCPDYCGWILRQHPQIETAFIATEAYSSMIYPGRGMLHPVSVVWCSDDTPLPWRTIKLWKDEDDEGIIVMMAGYKSTQVGWTFTYKEETSAPMMYAMGSFARRPTTPIRDLWALLATINDLPVRIEHVEPSRGYMARGSYKKFLKHSIVHLTVPATHWRKLITKTAAILRRRAHQVRGHWRKDWRFPLSRGCEHDFDERMVCKRCRGHQIWVHEHQRGDASMGFVTHDYDVTHDRNSRA